MRRELRGRLALMLVLALCLAVAVPATGFAAKKGGPPVAKSGLAPLSVIPADMYEADDSTATAKPAPVKSMHTFNVGDEDDYMSVTLEAGQPLMVETEYLGTGFFDTYTYVKDAEGTILASDDDSDVWSDTYESTVYFIAPAAGTYYIDVNNLSGEVYPYAVHVNKGVARRISGMDRFGTSNAVSKTIWGNTDNPQYGTGYGPTDIYVANAFSPADAAAGATLATRDDSVLLLTGKDTIPASVLAEIDRLTTSQYWDATEVTVWILGGTGTVSDAVAKQIEARMGVAEVKRIAGMDRYATAAEVASQTADKFGDPSTVFIVNGGAWADALAAAPAAAYMGSSVLYTKATELPAATAAFIADHGVTKAVVVGGSASVGQPVLDALGTLVGSSNVEVFAAANRYALALKLAQMGVDMGMNGGVAVIASGAAYADALSAGPVTTWTGGPLLLTRGDILSPEVTTFFKDNWGANPGTYVIGGSGTISDSVFKQILNLWRTAPPVS